MTEQSSITHRGYIRLSEILKKIPVGKTTWWDRVKTGEFPKPVKMGPKITAWRVEEIEKLMESFL